METEISFSYSQEPISGPYPLDESSPRPSILFI